MNFFLIFKQKTRKARENAQALTGEWILYDFFTHTK